MTGWLVVRDGDTLRDHLFVALFEAYEASEVAADSPGDALVRARNAVLNHLRDVGTPATTDTSRNSTYPVGHPERTLTRLVTDWTAT